MTSSKQYSFSLNTLKELWTRQSLAQRKQITSNLAMHRRKRAIELEHRCNNVQLACSSKSVSVIHHVKSLSLKSKPHDLGF